MKKLLFAIAFIMTATALMAQTGDEIMSASIKAMNHEGLKNVKTIKVIGTQFNAMLGQELTTTMYLKRPNKIRMEIEVMGMTITQAYNGNKGWMVNPLTGSDKRQDLPEEAVPELLRMFEMLESPLGEYGKEGNSFEFVGIETLDGKNYNKVKASGKEADATSTFYIDAVTNWFYKAVTVIPSEEGDATVELVYEEKTRKKGIILPAVVEVIYNGDKNAVIKFDEYELDIEIDDKIFDKL